MADSGALRQQRYKHHRAGDHRYCRHGPRPALAALPDPDPGEDLDPAAELRRLADRLTAAHEAEPGNAALARELRATLQALAPGAGAIDPELRAMFEAFR
jgi:hypothetical protein